MIGFLLVPWGWAYLLGLLALLFGPVILAGRRKR